MSILLKDGMMKKLIVVALMIASLCSVGCEGDKKPTPAASAPKATNSK
ncbi:MAG TPA: hypothetical protein PKD72_03705 [Gemmatales bacterium]|nr:hypothetical protein [Gemmatales bacterium]